MDPYANFFSITYQSKADKENFIGLLSLRDGFSGSVLSGQHGGDEGGFDDFLLVIIGTMIQNNWIRIKRLPHGRKGVKIVRRKSDSAFRHGDSDMSDNASLIQPTVIAITSYELN